MSWELLWSRAAFGNGRVCPEHIRFSLTNRRNAACSFREVRNWASASARSPMGCCNLELDEKHVEQLMFRMEHWRDFGLDTKAFGGSVCPRCIWGQHNRVLAVLTGPMEHERFV